MGIWDYVSSAIGTISGGVTRSREIVGGAAVWTSQAVVERMPDREGWQRIGWLGLRIADHAIDQGSKPFTGGVPVYRIAKQELSKNKSQEQPSKEKMENTELAKLKATIQNLEKKNMELEELRARMESIENRMKREEGWAGINGLGLRGPYPVNNKTKTESLNGATAVVELKKNDTRLRPGNQKVRIVSVDVNRELSYIDIDGDHFLHRCFLTIDAEMERELETAII